MVLVFVTQLAAPPASAQSMRTPYLAVADMLKRVFGSADTLRSFLSSLGVVANAAACSGVCPVA
jgi:hypothetical protein